jgi:hypothetical protein
LSALIAALALFHPYCITALLFNICNAPSVARERILISIAKNSDCQIFQIPQNAREVFLAKAACAGKLAILRVLPSDRVRQFFNPNGVAIDRDTATWQSCSACVLSLSRSIVLNGIQGIAIL